MKIENSNMDNSDLSSCEEVGIEDDKSTVLDHDHRLLLRNAKPLFQSRNAAVRTCYNFNLIINNISFFFNVSVSLVGIQFNLFTQIHIFKFN